MLDRLRRRLLAAERRCCTDLNEPPGSLARRLPPAGHGKNRPGEIRGRFHQLICAGSLEFVSGAITPEYAKRAHSNRMGAGNVISAVPDHETVRGQNFVLRQNMGEQFRLMIQPAARH